jgi:signal peptidase I
MRKREPPGRSRGLLEFVLTAAVALGLAFCVQAYAIKPYRIPSPSMEPTLQVGDRVLVNRFSHRLGAEPKVGQIVVFNPPSGADAAPARCGVTVSDASPCPQPTDRPSSQTFIKRVVGVGGDRIAVHGGHVLRDGAREADPYIAPCAAGEGCDLPRAITVPAGDVFLMGDNRGNSDDSRFWGPVPLAWVIGQAVSVYWPPSRVGTL